MNNNQSEESTLRQRLCFIFRFFTLRIINPESHLNPRYHKYDVIPVNCDSSSVRDSFHRLASLSHKGKESFSTPTPRNTMQQISRRKTEHVFTRRARTVVIEAQRERGMGNVSFSRCILIVLWSVISKPACCFFRPLVPIKSQHGSPKSARHYPHLVAPRKKQRRWSELDFECAQRDVGNPDRKGAKMKVSSPLTALHLSQANKQENHLKPKLIFFFSYSLEASEEEDLKYLVTFGDGMCHKDEQRWSRIKNIGRQ